MNEKLGPHEGEDFPWYISWPIGLSVFGGFVLSAYGASALRIKDTQKACDATYQLVNEAIKPRSIPVDGAVNMLVEVGKDQITLIDADDDGDIDQASYNRLPVRNFGTNVSYRIDQQLVSSEDLQDVFSDVQRDEAKCGRDIGWSLWYVNFVNEQIERLKNIKL